MDRFAIRRITVLLLVAIMVVVLCVLGTSVNTENNISFMDRLRFSDKKVTSEKQLLLPSIDSLKTLNISESVSLMHRYTNTYQLLCRNQLRVGTVFDGGKEVCIDRPVAPKKPCLVYSYGSNNKFDFETAVILWFGCDVHTFDPSMSHIALDKIQNPRGCTFHPTGLGSNDTTINGNWKIRTLGTTMKELQHEHTSLDILKIDIEGAEWSAIPEMIASGAIYRVKQLQIEFHFNKKRLADQLVVLKGLYDAGFRIFNRERNIFCPPCNVFYQELGHWVSYNIEMSFVNIRFV